MKKRSAKSCIEYRRVSKNQKQISLAQIHSSHSSTFSALSTFQTNSIFSSNPSQSTTTNTPKTLPNHTLTQPTDHQTYLSIFYRSMLYIRKTTNRTIIDDGIMVQQLSEHVTLSSHPLPITRVGDMLLKNGYIVTAYCVLMSRLYRSRIYYQYLMGVFYGGYDILGSLEEFLWYLGNGLEGVGLVDLQDPKDNQKRKILTAAQRNNLKRTDIDIK